MLLLLLVLLHSMHAPGLPCCGLMPLFRRWQSAWGLTGVAHEEGQQKGRGPTLQRSFKIAAVQVPSESKEIPKIDFWLCWVIL